MKFCSRSRQYTWFSSTGRSSGSRSPARTRASTPARTCSESSSSCSLRSSARTRCSTVRSPVIRAQSARPGPSAGTTHTSRLSRSIAAVTSRSAIEMPHGQPVTGAATGSGGTGTYGRLPCSRSQVRCATSAAARTRSNVQPAAFEPGLSSSRVARSRAASRMRTSS